MTVNVSSSDWSRESAPCLPLEIYDQLTASINFDQPILFLEWEEYKHESAFKVAKVYFYQYLKKMFEKRAQLPWNGI